MSHKPIIIMAGGTGGHVYPALAVAGFLQQQGIPLLWLGTAQGLESRVVPEQGYKLFTINIGGLRGKGLYRWVIAPFVISYAMLQVMIIFIKKRPAAVLGMGGFVSGPGGLVAWLMRIPLCIHEQNAIAGLTNRILSPLAHTIMAAFPDAFNKRPGVRVTGNPVRSEILKARQVKAKTHADKVDDPIMRILVIGGSQGASILNEIIPDSLSLLPEEVQFEVRHQTGKNLFIETTERYRTLNITAQLEPFINDMGEVYSWADIVICRAGALTISELAVVGVASILVPFPCAVDDHQTANASYLSDHDAAILLPQSRLNKNDLARLLYELYQSRIRLHQMAKNARSRAKLDATRQVSELCLEAAYA